MAQKPLGAHEIAYKVLDQTPRPDPTNLMPKEGGNISDSPRTVSYRLDLDKGNVNGEKLYKMLRTHKGTNNSFTKFPHYLVHRVNHLDQYDDPEIGKMLDKEFLSRHNLPDGELPYINQFHLWMIKNPKLIAQLIQHKNRLHKMIERGIGFNTTKVNGETFIALTQPLATSVMGPQPALASALHKPVDDLGTSYKHHIWLPLKDLWFSYKLGPKYSLGYDETSHNDEVVISNTGPRYRATEEDVKKNNPRGNPTVGGIKESQPFLGHVYLDNPGTAGFAKDIPFMQFHANWFDDADDQTIARSLEHKIKAGYDMNDMAHSLLGEGAPGETLDIPKSAGAATFKVLKKHRMHEHFLDHPAMPREVALEEATNNSRSEQTRYKAMRNPNLTTDDLYKVAEGLYTDGNSSTYFDDLYDHLTKNPHWTDDLAMRLWDEKIKPNYKLVLEEGQDLDTHQLDYVNSLLNKSKTPRLVNEIYKDLPTADKLSNIIEAGTAEQYNDINGLLEGVARCPQLTEQQANDILDRIRTVNDRLPKESRASYLAFAGHLRHVPDKHINELIKRIEKEPEYDEDTNPEDPAHFSIFHKAYTQLENMMTVAYNPTPAQAIRIYDAMKKNSRPGFYGDFPDNILDTYCAYQGDYWPNRPVDGESLRGFWQLAKKQLQDYVEGKPYPAPYYQEPANIIKMLVRNPSTPKDILRDIIKFHFAKNDKGQSVWTSGYSALDDLSNTRIDITPADILDSAPPNFEMRQEHMVPYDEGEGVNYREGNAVDQRSFRKARIVIQRLIRSHNGRVQPEPEPEPQPIQPIREEVPAGGIVQDLPLVRSEQIREWLIKNDLFASNNLDSKPNAEHVRIGELMSGFGPQVIQLFNAARFLVGGELPTVNQIRRALSQSDEDIEAAALRCYNIEVTDANRRALLAVSGLSSFKKDMPEIISVPSIEPINPESQEIVEALSRAFKVGAVQHVALNGKHSKGSMVAKDPKTGTAYLIKPGSGQQSPAAGAREEVASQSQREVAFWQVANEWGLGDTMPEAELIKVNGNLVAVLTLLPISFKNLGMEKKKDPQIVPNVLEPYRQNGTLHKWAVIDFVLGNTDRHSQNIMIDAKDSRVMLIDHGSAFAGHSFDPANDQDSFIPYYLRAFTSQAFSELTSQDRLQFMPRISEEIEKLLANWIESIDENKLQFLLQKYGINPEATLTRLGVVKMMPGPKDQAINKLWCGLNW